MGAPFPWPKTSFATKALPLALAWVLVFSGVASAHRPFFPGAGASDPVSAVRVADPSVSHVIYAQLTVEAPYRWFVLDNDAPRELAVQLGVPAGPLRQEVDPVVVLFGPGLSEPPAGLPVRSPQGGDVGAIVISPAGEPRPFHEPVTGTESWIVAETQVELPSAGTYYGVVYDAKGRAAKVWVAMGQREGFSWRDLTRLPGWIRDVRRFHEVSGWPAWAWVSAAVLVALLSLALGWVLRRRRRF